MDPYQKIEEDAKHMRKIAHDDSTTRHTKRRHPVLFVLCSILFVIILLLIIGLLLMRLMLRLLILSRLILVPVLLVILVILGLILFISR